jgi:hypothetical protein
LSHLGQISRSGTGQRDCNTQAASVLRNPRRSLRTLLARPLHVARAHRTRRDGRATGSDRRVTDPLAASRATPAADGVVDHESAEPAATKNGSSASCAGYFLSIRIAGTGGGQDEDKGAGSGQECGCARSSSMFARNSLDSQRAASSSRTTRSLWNLLVTPPAMAKDTPGRACL